MKGQLIYIVSVFVFFLNCVWCNSKNNNKRRNYKKKEDLKNFDNIVLDDFYSSFDSQHNYENKLKKNEDDIIGQGIFSLISKNNQEKEKTLKGETEENKPTETEVQGEQNTEDAQSAQAEEGTQADDQGAQLAQPKQGTQAEQAEQADQADQSPKADEPVQKPAEEKDTKSPVPPSQQNGDSNNNTSHLNTPTVKRLDEIFDDVLTQLNKKSQVDTDANKDKYNEFKKEFDMFTMNVTEYEIIKKLLVTFSETIDKNNQIETKIEHIFNKALTDNKYKEQFKNFIYGLYSFTKRHNYITVNKTDETTVHKALFENALNLINTI
ncbi:MSP7-like protein, putative [Plasmodium sp. gorilla clade G2]|uniref:MSP7-like protein, putative n=1 Tax=Plasmodium sp. gorilla clade G2 TaxID=880535 RepID=UPI000D2EF3CB|nr:MSP7-like protein, putative [Plasmodium sp. gorilla clade G2]SOV20109.1 MSP7-like protein, putative [Plasmodium sp. gorilla clade G2]